MQAGHHNQEKMLLQSFRIQTDPKIMYEKSSNFLSNSAESRSNKPVDNWDETIPWHRNARVI